MSFQAAVYVAAYGTVHGVGSVWMMWLSYSQRHYKEQAFLFMLYLFPAVLAATWIAGRVSRRQTAPPGTRYYRFRR